MRASKRPYIGLGALLATFLTLLVGCSVKYSFTGASIPREVNTVTVENFPNLAPIVNPTLSSAFSERLRERFLQQTSLSLVEVGGDFEFSGEITRYSVEPAGMQGNERAALNRLTIGVHVKFVSRFDEKANYDRTFSAYEDFPAAQDLPSVEQGLCTAILEKIIEQVFNAAVANW